MDNERAIGLPTEERATGLPREVRVGRFVGMLNQYSNNPEDEGLTGNDGEMTRRDFVEETGRLIFGLYGLLQLPELNAITSLAREGSNPPAPEIPAGPEPLAQSELSIPSTFADVDIPPEQLIALNLEPRTFTMRLDDNGELVELIAIAEGPDGKFYQYGMRYTDGKYDPFSAIQPALTDPKSIAIATDGTTYIGDNGAIYKVEGAIKTPILEDIGTVRQVMYPLANGNLFIQSGNSVYIYNRGTQTAQRLELGVAEVHSKASLISSDGDGTVICLGVSTDGENDGYKQFKFDNQGNLVSHEFTRVGDHNSIRESTALNDRYTLHIDTRGTKLLTRDSQSQQPDTFIEASYAGLLRQFETEYGLPDYGGVEDIMGVYSEPMGDGQHLITVHASYSQSGINSPGPLVTIQYINDTPYPTGDLANNLQQVTRVQVAIDNNSDRYITSQHCRVRIKGDPQAYSLQLIDGLGVRLVPLENATASIIHPDKNLGQEIPPAPNHEVRLSVILSNSD